MLGEWLERISASAISSQIDWRLLRISSIPIPSRTGAPESAAPPWLVDFLSTIRPAFQNYTVSAELISGLSSKGRSTCVTKRSTSGS